MATILYRKNKKDGQSILTRDFRSDEYHGEGNWNITAVGMSGRGSSLHSGGRRETGT